ncbi:acyl-CoA dehydrogenase family protein [Nocardioides sp. NPDC057764]|uniref:acyl-CoA dehydrogenase family protein n=1 Tax=Nocardioides sp. NPDC057764 TaxID=3346243 RepID=UPI0036727DD9
MERLDYEEQADYRDWIREGLAWLAPLDRSRVLVEEGRRTDLRAGLGEMGVLGLAVGAEHGGADAGPEALAIFLEEAGRVLLPAAHLTSVAVVPFVLRQDLAGTGPDLLAALAGGEAVVTIADLDDPERPVTLADGSATGTKVAVIDADVATHALVVVGDAIVVLDLAGPGVHIEHLDNLDRTRPVARLHLETAPVVPLGLADAATVIAETRTLLRLAIASETAGQVAACCDLSVDYAKTRHQFGRPIGGFQAVKHACADMFVAAQATSAAVAAAYASWFDEPGHRDLVAPATIAYALRAGFDVAASTMQIHGGIAFTAEAMPQLYLKRAKAAQLLAGGVDATTDWLAAAILDGATDPLAPILGRP